MNNLWCTNYSSVRTNTRFTVCGHITFKDMMTHVINRLLQGNFSYHTLYQPERGLICISIDIGYNMKTSI